MTRARMRTPSPKRSGTDCLIDIVLFFVRQSAVATLEESGPASRKGKFRPTVQLRPVPLAPTWVDHRAIPGQGGVRMFRTAIIRIAPVQESDCVANSKSHVTQTQCRCAPMDPLSGEP